MICNNFSRHVFDYNRYWRRHYDELKTQRNEDSGRTYSDYSSEDHGNYDRDFDKHYRDN